MFIVNTCFYMTGRVAERKKEKNTSVRALMSKQRGEKRPSLHPLDAKRRTCQETSEGDELNIANRLCNIPWTL